MDESGLTKSKSKGTRISGRAERKETDHRQIGETERARRTRKTLWVYESLRGTEVGTESKVRGSSNYPTTVSYLFHLRAVYNAFGHYFYRASNTSPSIARIPWNTPLRVRYHRDENGTRKTRATVARLSLFFFFYLKHVDVHYVSSFGK